MDKRIAKALAEAEVLSSMPESDREGLAGIAVIEEREESEILVSEGERGEDLYLIVEGRAGVSAKIGGESRHLASLQPGDYFGEMAAMSGHRRHATVVALTDLVVVRFPREPLEVFLDDFPYVRLKLEEVGARRFLEDAERELNGER